MVVAVGDTVCPPAVALPPDQPPLAVQVSALATLHVSVESPPWAMRVGEAVMVISGAAAALTATSARAVPPSPSHSRTKLALPFNGGEFSVPLVDLSPVQAPLARQTVACSDVQIRRVDAPSGTVSASAVRDTSGTGGGGGSPPVTVMATVSSTPPPLAEHFSA